MFTVERPGLGQLKTSLVPVVEGASFPPGTSRRRLRTSGGVVRNSVAMLLFSARGPRTGLADHVQKEISPEIELPEPRCQGQIASAVTRRNNGQ
jgi:hypothetical protein